MNTSQLILRSRDWPLFHPNSFLFGYTGGLHSQPPLQFGLASGIGAKVKSGLTHRNLQHNLLWSFPFLWLNQVGVATMIVTRWEQRGSQTPHWRGAPTTGASVWRFIWARNKPLRGKGINIRDFVIAASTTWIDTPLGGGVVTLSLAFTPTGAVCSALGLTGARAFLVGF